MRPGRPLRLGFLGAGFVARAAVAPAAAAAAGVRPVAVAARDPDRAAAVVDGARVHRGYDDLLEDPDVDAVYCSLTNDAHRRWVLAALAAGKHVLCEKPLVLDAAEVEEMIGAAERAGRLLVEASWYRWHPRTRAAEALVAGGGLGRVVAVDAGFTFTLAGPPGYRLDPAMGGGALYDVGCYALSAAVWALGAGALDGAAVTAVARRLGPNGVDLSTEARLDLPEASVRIGAAFDRPERQWLEVTGTAGRLRFGAPAFTAWTDDRADLELDPGPTGRNKETAGNRETARDEETAGDGETGRAGPTGGEEWPPVDAYRLMLEAFADACAGGSAWVVPPRDSLAVARALDAVRLAPAS